MAGGRKSKESRQEQSRREREEIANIQQSFSMNLDDAYTRVMAKKAGVDLPVGHPGNTLHEKPLGHDEHGNPVFNEQLNWDSVLTQLGKAPREQQPATTQKVASNMNPQQYFQPRQPPTISLAVEKKTAEAFKPVIDELSRYKFASGEKKLSQVVTAIRETMQKFAIQEVAKITKEHYSNAERFQYIDNGVRVTFSLDDKVKVAVKVAGAFRGDEIICLERNGDEASAYVLRSEGSGFTDISDGFELGLEAIGSK
jgi:hypothetical protein